MNPPDLYGNNSSPGAPHMDAEQTLRLIASLPAPQGLSERVYAGLRTAQAAGPRPARVLAWPTALRPSRQWMSSTAMRSAAAAAIVFVVAGGGWGVYTRVQQSQPARVLVMPPHVAAPGGFSSGAAIRTPQSPNGPVLTHPLSAQPHVKPLRVLPPKVMPKVALDPVVRAPVFPVPLRTAPKPAAPQVQ
jgi:hypothetical protein